MTPDPVLIHNMFSRIARRYDAANDAVSFGIHRRWRRLAVAKSQVQRGARVLDCASGTGDLALAFADAAGDNVIGTDFNVDMLAFAEKKSAERGSKVQWRQADAMALPFADASFDVASISFGIRNVANPEKCLQEMARVLEPGGTVVILEMGQPSAPFSWVYEAYSSLLMPLVGAFLTRDLGAYEYLQASASRFPSGTAFTQKMEAHFESIEAIPLMFGVAYLYVGSKR